MWENMVRHVDEVAFTHTKSVGKFDCLFYRLMRWMGLMTESVDDERVDALQIFVFLFGDARHVCDIREIAYAETYDRELCVEHSYGDDFDRISYYNRCVRLHVEEVDGRHSRVAAILRREAVWDALEEMVGTEFLRIYVDIAEYTVWAKVVESAHMVVMLVGDEHGIEFAEVNSQHLFTKIGTTVDKDSVAVHIDHSAATQAFIARIGACAYWTCASYLGDTA